MQPRNIRIDDALSGFTNSVGHAPGRRRIDAALQRLGSIGRAGYQQSARVPLNPFAAEEGESLPPGTRRNYHGRLVREKLTIEASELDSEFLDKEVGHLRQHVVIVSFAQGTANDPRNWLQDLKDAIVPGRVLT